jgi:hypothetical protein
VAASKIGSGLVYNDVLGDGIDARYSVRPEKVKGDIVLNRPSDFSGYSMDINAEGLTAVKVENNSVEFLNDKKDVAFILQTPYMYDAADDITYDINIEIEETSEGCRIVFTPNAEWLNAEERSYPVVIDPTVVVGTDSSKATPRNERLKPLLHACLHLFRHIARKCSAIHKVLPAFFRQSDEKSDGAIAQQSLCGVALMFTMHMFINWEC